MAAKRNEVSESARSKAAQAEIFQLLADGSTWPEWSPISSFRLESESSEGGEGVGAIRAFRTGAFTALEEIVRVQSPTHFGYKLLKSKALHVRNYEAEVTLEKRPGGGTVITWTGSFTPLFPGSGWIWKRIIARLYRQFAEGLATYADQLD